MGVDDSLGVPGESGALHYRLGTVCANRLYDATLVGAARSNRTQCRLGDVAGCCSSRLEGLGIGSTLLHGKLLCCWGEAERARSNWDEIVVHPLPDSYISEELLRPKPKMSRYY